MRATRWCARRGRFAPSGKLGEIRKVAVEYLQGWMSKPIETTGQKQAAWRADPALNGPGGCIGDIGTHAFHLLEYVTGLEVTGINATLRSVVPGRRLDDDCNEILRMNNGAARSADGFAGGGGRTERGAACASMARTAASTGVSRTRTGCW